jgi:TolB protein
LRTITATVVVAGLALWAPDAGAQLPPKREYTEISGTGQTLWRIAIPTPVDGGGASEPAKTIAAVMSNDMLLSGLFKPLNPSGFLANLGREGTGIELDPWVNVGAQAVVKAKVTVAGGQLAADFYLYDLAKGATAVVRKSYKAGAKGARGVAHRFSDEVLKYYTGDRGMFSSKIAFVGANPRKGISHVYAMDYDGHGVYRVSSTGNQNALPAWSPSGQIAYTSWLWQNPDLFLTGGGGRAYRISKYPGLNIGAAFSPSGGAIALTLSKDGNPEIYTIGLSGAIQRRLTANGAIDTSPTWSPGGDRIAFVSNRGGSPQIYLMSAGGGSAKRLTFRGSYNQEPAWCPRSDTPLVAFTARDERGAFDIFTVNVDSGEMKRLTQGEGSNKSPTWSPNGRLVAFSSSRGGLWLMTKDGLNQQRVYRGGAQTPAWSR